MKVRSIVAALVFVAARLTGDEGMWTFDNPPLTLMKTKYRFSPDEKWLEHLRLSALEFGGGSGAFVSKDGLVLTNHHVGRRYIQGVSESGDKDYMKNGFVAKSKVEELKIPGLTIYTLMKAVDVTDKVNGAVKPGMDEKQATRARMEKLSKLRDDLDKRDGLRAWHVSLYKGGEFWLYVYKAHQDVRLVMAPESQIAYFGGDEDNFTYPRHDLDFALFRVYEGGEPYHPPHFLKWAGEELKEGDLTFVAGRPGRTRRLETIAQMKFQRDVVIPREIMGYEARRTALREYGKISPEHARKVSTDLFSVENNLKGTSGHLDGLRDPRAFKELERKEDSLRAAVSKDPRLLAEAGESWDRIETSVEQMKPLVHVETLVNRGNSRLLQTALELVRCVQELDRPEEERLQGYRTKDAVSAAKWRLERSIDFGDLEMETFLVTRGLEDIQAHLEPDHPFRKAVLAGRGPSELAKEIVTGTKLQHMHIRTDLLRRGSKGLAKSQDPLIQLARTIESFVREMASKRESLQAVIEEHSGRIARARFVLYGKSLYPDATGTLRLSFGPLEGYVDKGVRVQPFTTFEDLYKRAHAKGPVAGNGAWALPARWHERKGALDPRTPLNFCHQVDIVGGNSGSPVVNAKGELVGLVFDGNLQSLPGSYYYDEKVNRAVSVDARAILESLIKVFDAKHLAEELVPR